ncbi:restriction endonuclease subunit S [Vibrio campbellii]|uniref:restriction endonuclease subunit S n=1 Tax=Vibrio campbellii TaxID=680 RepID=UPI00142E1BAC|nr:restriction endonuclease subunit S [Vibrio campbellii]NIY88815.1 type I restriction endonuclease subunit S [Vibrio campbellii]NVK70760.1 restriction endonuclease subunit S [Vibrio campbellii]
MIENSKKSILVEGSYSHKLEIPSTWEFAKLNEVIEIVGGSQPPKSDFMELPEGDCVRLIQIRDYKSDNNIVYIPRNKAKRFVDKNEVMIGRYGPPIFQILRGLEGAYNVALMKAKPRDGVFSNEYLYYYLSNKNIYNYVESASDRTAGQSGVNKKHLEQYPVGVPPLAEQKRIVEKLDDVLAQVDTIKARLDGIPDLLKRFRQSVLASAVSGKLTEEWRGGAKFDVIESMLVELAKFIDYRGKTPKKTDSGVPLITAKNIKPGYISRTPEEFIAEDDYDGWMTRGFPKVGDILMTTEAPLGNVALIDIEEKFALAQRAICLQFTDERVKSEYACIYMRSMSFQEALLSNATGSTVKGIKASLLKKIVISYPEKEEQKEIVRLVDQYFAFADTIETQVKKAQARVDNLTQSILAKAFRGELVEQDPSDEPADKLLERIAEARKEAEALAKAAKKAETAKKRAAKKATENS